MKKSNLPFLLILLLGLLSRSAICQFTIIVNEIPANTPENDPLYIAGDFNGWNPGDSDFLLKLDTTNNHYVVQLPGGTANIQYKFTRGSWEKVESDVNGNYIPNRSYTPVIGDTLYQQIEGWEDLDGNGGSGSTASENVRILTDSFYMEQLERYRRIWIYLPSNYEESSENYPVLYMHDGQNVFDERTSFVGEWQVDETLDQLFEEGDPGIIVVAIDHGGNKRISEMTPWPNAQYGGGDGDLYLDFIINDLKPYIDEQYRTKPGRMHTGIAGSSLGGHISTYAALKYPEIFSKIGALSPAYWINPELKDFISNFEKSTDFKIYQLMGSLEGDSFVEQMYIIEDSLRKVGFIEEELTSVEKADGQHSEWFWAREFRDAYLWLFSETVNATNETGSEPPLFKITPNPAIDSLHLSVNEPYPSLLLIELLNANGQTLYKLKTQWLQKAGKVISIDLIPLQMTAGSYFCKLSDGKMVRTIPFTKI